MFPAVILSDSDVFKNSRRSFLKLATASLCGLSRPAISQVDFWSLPRELWLFRPSTGEQVREVYWADGELVVDGYIAICNLLRDTHLNLSVQFDLVTLDILRSVQGWAQDFGYQEPILVNSGYRHPRTNASEGGVLNSWHTKAKAVDFKLLNISAEKITRFGMYLQAGGVGFYPSKGFTHLDSGNVRHWRG